MKKFTIEMENGGKMIGELYPERAPITVQNFEELANKGFYDGLIFHRVIPGFMIQGGDPEGTGMGGSGKRIKGEFLANGIPNPLKHTRGVLSMARSMHKAAPYLDGEYAAFGKVTEGMDVADAIVDVGQDYNDRPIKEQKMKSIRVENVE